MTAAETVRAQRRGVIIAATRRAEAGRTSDAVTPAQALVFDAVKTAVSTGGTPPSIRELAATTGHAPSTVAYHLNQLKAKGLLHHEPGKARTLALAGTAPCPHCNGTGHIPGGAQ